MGLAISIAPLTADHWSAVRAIYEEGIATGHATFAKSAPEWGQWDAGHLPSCRSVAISESEVVGFAALSPVSIRAVYAGVAEVSVYVAHRARGQGVGLALLTALVAESERAGSGRCRPASFRRTFPVLSCISAPAFASPARASASAAWTDAGATLCFWNAEARWLAFRNLNRSTCPNESACFAAAVQASAPATPRRRFRWQRTWPQTIFRSSMEAATAD
jgi:L-amino acid N-acyltransferase YncA